MCVCVRSFSIVGHNNTVVLHKSRTVSQMGSFRCIPLHNSDGTGLFRGTDLSTSASENENVLLLPQTVIVQYRSVSSGRSIVLVHEMMRQLI